jgi:WD40 repeat protein
MSRQLGASNAKIMAAASMVLAGGLLSTAPSWADAEHQPQANQAPAVSPGNAPRTVWIAHDGPVSDIRFIGHKQIISTGWDGYFRQWSGSGKPLNKAIKLHETWITRISLCNQEQFVMTASRDRTLKQIDLVTGSVVGKPLVGHENGVESLALSSDCKEVLSGSSDGSMRRWEVASGRYLDIPFVQEKGNQTVRDIALDPSQSSRFAFALKTSVGLVPPAVDWTLICSSCGLTDGIRLSGFKG